MMTKRSILCIVFSISISSFNLIYSQFYNNTWINGNLGVSGIAGEFGKSTSLGLNNGLNMGVQIIKQTNFGMNIGVGYQYDHINNSDLNTRSSSRDYKMETNLHELEFVLNFNLVPLFIENYPFKFSIGWIYSLYQVKHNLNHADTLVNGEIYKNVSTGTITYPNLILSYDFGNIQLGLNSKIGFSNNDYLDGLHSRFSKSNDLLLVTSISLGYRIL